MTTVDRANHTTDNQEDLLTRLASQHNLASLLDCIVSEAMQPISLYDKDGEANHHNVASHAALTRKTVTVTDAYEDDDFDFSGTKKFDESTGYRSTSFLTQPLLDHQGEVIGVLQLLNAQDARGEVVEFASSDLPHINALAKYAAISLNNQILIHSHKEFLDSFIKALASITDVRSPHTSLHCQRIPELTELIARAACEDKTGYFKDFNLDDEEWYELSVAAWLHDCGKLATPDYVVDKATKLHMIWDDDCAFLETANTGGEFMRPEDQERVRSLAHVTWQNEAGETVPLLSDEEVHNLCISRGTLNDEERATINRHIDITIDILEAHATESGFQHSAQHA